MSIRPATPILAAGLLILASAAANAQLLGGVGQTVGGVGQTVGNTVGGAIGGTNEVGQPRVASTARLGQSTLNYVGGLGGAISADGLVDARRVRLQALVSANRRTLEMDENGQPVTRGMLVAVSPTPVQLAIAAQLGFRQVAVQAHPELALSTVSLAIPPRTSLKKARFMLQRDVPGLAVDYDHVFEPAGGPLATLAATGLASSSQAMAREGLRIVMIDGGAASHPSLSRASIEQRGFSGKAAATGHGTAVASLLVGDQGPFRGAARGAQLFVADVYGGNPAAGSARSIVAALAWAVSKRPSVITMSIVGPPNRALGAAISALAQRGIQVVAAVGNDGPAAPPAYPASYPSVVAVTGVDGKGRALMEAGKASHIDFAAPGADLIAAAPGSDYVPVRGTSFAAPLAAARLAQAGSAARLAVEAIPGKGRVGRGIVCAACATPPKAAKLKR